MDDLVVDVQTVFAMRALCDLLTRWHAWSAGVEEQVALTMLFTCSANESCM